MELQKGRPKYTAGRLEKEIRTYDLLDKLGVEYERVDHEAAMTMEVCQEIDKVLQFDEIEGSLDDSPYECRGYAHLWSGNSWRSKYSKNDR